LIKSIGGKQYVTWLNGESRPLCCYIILNTCL